MSNLKLLRLDEGRTFCLNLEVAVPEKQQCFGDRRPKRYTEEEILTYVSDEWIERILHDTLDNRSIDSIFVYGKKIVKSTKLGIFITPMQAALFQSVAGIGSSNGSTILHFSTSALLEKEVWAM